MNRELAKAIAFASEIHRNQLDKSGMPYILHPIRVMDKVMERTNNDLGAAIIAICHDTIEDGFKDDYEKGFKVFSEVVTDDTRILRNLRLVTFKPSNTLQEYLAQVKLIKDSGDIWSIQSKIADNEDNLLVTRLKGLKDSDFIRIRKYHISHCYLSGKTDKLLDLA